MAFDALNVTPTSGLLKIMSSLKVKYDGCNCMNVLTQEACHSSPSQEGEGKTKMQIHKDRIKIDPTA